VTNQAQQGGGTLVRTPDGSLFYISDTDLNSHRLPPDKEAKVREVIEGDLHGFQSLDEDEMPLVELNTALGIPVAASKTKTIKTSVEGGFSGL
jgi:hypothetical protein